MVLGVVNVETVAAAAVPWSFALKGQDSLAWGKRNAAPGPAQPQWPTLKGRDNNLCTPGNANVVPGRRPLRSLAQGYVVLPLRGKIRHRLASVHHDSGVLRT